MTKNTYRTFDEKVAGKLFVKIDEGVEGQRESATVTGFNATRKWIDNHGGYSTLDSNKWDGQLSGWSIMRVYPGYGHRCCGSITPVED